MSFIRLKSGIMYTRNITLNVNRSLMEVLGSVRQRDGEFEIDDSDELPLESKNANPLYDSAFLAI